MPVPAAGDTLNLYVGGDCGSRTPVRGVVRYVGSGLIWVEDVDNPGRTFTAADLQPLDNVYTDVVVPVLAEYFGTDDDVDGNGRVIVLITKEVNRRGQNLIGFVSAVDFSPPGLCATSNYGEIFYGVAPDPGGQYGTARFWSDVVGLYPRLLAHEITHVIQFSEILFHGSAASKTAWEREGSATLAEQLAGNRDLGYQSGQDLGFEVMWDHQNWYWPWVGDLAHYFGWEGDPGTTRVIGAPEECTWIGTAGLGNTGPCKLDGRDIYGIPATLLRYVLDRWGPDYPGGEGALMRRFSASTKSGYANLEDVTGASITTILIGFASALWADGRYYDALTSWNLYDIFSSLSANWPSMALQPYLNSTTEPSLTVSVRGGSTAYLQWIPSGAPVPTSLRLRTPADGQLPADMVLWVLRMK